VPARSRITVSPSPRANLTRVVPLSEALRGSRAALGQMVGELDALLAKLREGTPFEAATLRAAADGLELAKQKAETALEGVRPRSRRRL
jgi:hypothetical protein